MMSDASDPDDDLKKKTKPSQESELPDENVEAAHEPPSLDEQKRTLFQQCPENSDKPNLDVHVKDILYSRRQPVESEDSDSSASPRSEPTDNEEFSKVSLRDKDLEPQPQSFGHVLPCASIMTSNGGDDLSNIHTQDKHQHDPLFVLQQEFVRQHSGTTSCESSASASDLRRAFAQSRNSEDSFTICKYSSQRRKQNKKKKKKRKKERGREQRFKVSL